MSHNELTHQNGQPLRGGLILGCVPIYPSLYQWPHAASIHLVWLSLIVTRIRDVFIKGHHGRGRQNQCTSCPCDKWRHQARAIFCDKVILSSHPSFMHWPLLETHLNERIAWCHFCCIVKGWFYKKEKHLSPSKWPNIFTNPNGVKYVLKTV